MKVMDRPSRNLGSHAKPTNQLQSQFLDPVEIRLIAEGKLERLADFAASSRLHTPDPKGDTPLHLAARIGNLAVCDLFIRSGADPGSLNHDRQTPADVAFLEGHGLAAQLLSSLVAMSPKSADENEDVAEIDTAAVRTDEVPEQRFTVVQEPDDTTDGLDDLLSFNAEAEPEEFFGQYTGETASGTFLAVVSSAPTVFDDEDGDWELDLSPAQIAGEGIGSSAAVVADHGAEHDFLKVRNRGPQSVKRAVVQTGTRLSIDPEICITWAEDTLAKGWCSFDDVDRLAALCEGNGDLEELRINLQLNLEAAGFELVDQMNGHDVGLWEAGSDVSSDDLAEAIEAALTRTTRLPGTQRFAMDKRDELRLLDPMVRAKHYLHLSILSCEAAVKTIIDSVDRIRDGNAARSSATLKFFNPKQLEYSKTLEFFAAADSLKLWLENGRGMDGKKQRVALAALDALDLSPVLYKEVIKHLEGTESGVKDAIRLGTLTLDFESATEHFILEHLPYARRFSARNVKECEDPEEVFQVTFTGLQRSTRSFAPERGIRFVAYCNFWMRSVLTKWRAGEVTSIRVPARLHEDLAKLDRALDKLDVRADGFVSDIDLAAELEWTASEVRQLRRIPREAEYPASDDDWDDVLPVQVEANVFDQAKTERIVRDALAELPERQANVIRMRFGIGRDADMTLEEVGQIYGVTRARIRQIEAKGLDRLSHPSRKRRLQELLRI